MTKKALYHFNDEEWQTPTWSVWLYIINILRKNDKRKFHLN